MLPVTLSLNFWRWSHRADWPMIVAIRCYASPPLAISALVLLRLPA
jgi:hypothetical protein